MSSSIIYEFSFLKKGADNLNNIREVGISVSRYKTVLVEETATNEKILSINHNLFENRITVITEFLNSTGESVKTDNILIYGSDYSLLMSNSEVFGSEKEIDVFTYADVWHVIDLVRSKQTI